MEVPMSKRDENYDEPRVIPSKSATVAIIRQPPLLGVSSDYAIWKVRVTTHLRKVPATEHFDYLLLIARYSNGKFSPNVIYISQTFAVFLRNKSTISDLKNLFWAIRSVDYFFFCVSLNLIVNCGFASAHYRFFL